ncbi:MAG: deoxyuridine 5'-triphosphate nucleotidohydrolase [Myxococcales bacterium SG8_38]|nr:MAG: deoxyuridine 5'-triphosphate nucleotidohydrolase [Myxococcales bacterium SG8_38]
MPEVRVYRMRPNAVVPSYETKGAAGMDLAACLDAPIVLEPGGVARVPTGLQIALPAGHEGQVRPRSGLAARHGVTVLNAPGTIDEDYRGEVQVLLINHGSEPFSITHGARVAQLIVARVTQAEVRVVDEEAALGETKRGQSGFGSTGA